MKSKTFSLALLILWPMALSAAPDPNTGHFKNLSVTGTASVNEVVVTNGFTWNGVRKTNWTDAFGANLMALSTNNGVNLTNLSAAAFNTNTLQLALGSLGPVTPVSYTTANLPAGQSAGAYAWCSDTLSPWTAVGGAPVYYSSELASWRLMASKISPASTLLSYMENCAKSTWTGETALDLAVMLGDGSTIGQSTTAGGIANFGGILNGTATAVDSRSGDGPYVKGFFQTSSTTPAGANLYTSLMTGVGAGANAAVQFSSYLNVSVLSSGTDVYLQFFGLYDTYSTTNLPNYAVGFLYDKNQVLSTSAAVNNWQLATATNGVWTFSDTGIAVSTTAGALPEKLSVVWVPGSAIAYTNQVAAVTNSVNLPAGQTVLAFGLKRYQVAGAQRYCRYYYPYLHIRRAGQISGL